MQPFIYQTHPQRIVFRAGALATLGAEADTLHARKLLVLCTPNNATWPSAPPRCWARAAPASSMALSCTCR